MFVSSKEGCNNDRIVCYPLSLFQELGLTVERDEITTWLTSDLYDPGVQMLTDTEICDLVSKSCDSSES